MSLGEDEFDQRLIKIINCLFMFVWVAGMCNI